MLLLPLTAHSFTAETMYLYPESRLIVCVGLWQFSHDFHTTDGTRVGIFWWRTAACSLQQHGVFTHCGFTTTTSNKTPKRTMWLQQNHTCNSKLLHSTSVRLCISINKRWRFYGLFAVTVVRHWKMKFPTCVKFKFGSIGAGVTLQRSTIVQAQSGVA